jgi:hypothetical protein
MPLRLSDEQLAAVLRVATPLAAADRDAFLQAIADALRGHAEVGDGTLFRVLREMHRFREQPSRAPVGSRRAR